MIPKAKPREHKHPLSFRILKGRLTPHREHMSLAPQPCPYRSTHPTAPRETPSLEGGWLAGFSAEDPFPPLLREPGWSRQLPSLAKREVDHGGTWVRRAGLWGTRAVLVLSTATMPLPARLCGARPALTQTSRGKDRPDSQRSRSKPLHCSSSGSFLLKDKCSVCDQTYLYLFSFPPRPAPAQTGQRAGFQAVEMVSGEAWNFPVSQVCQRQAASILGSLGKWGISQDGKGPPSLW